MYNLYMPNCNDFNNQEDKCKSSVDSSGSKDCKWKSNIKKCVKKARVNFSGLGKRKSKKCIKKKCKKTKCKCNCKCNC